MSRIVNLQEVRQREGKRLVDKKHLDRLRLLGCCVCGRRGVEIHHLLHFTGGTKRGMGKKAGDNFTVALCPDHHRDAHREPTSFERKYGLAPDADYQWLVTLEMRKEG